MIGEGIDRVDGRAKAQGAVVFSGDLVLEGMVHAALVQSPISNGRIAALDAARATSLAGVLAVLHHGNAPRLAPRGAGEMPLLLQDDRINYGGQPIAAVIAETLAAARRAAGLVEARCESRPSVSILRRDAPDLFAPAAVLGEPPDSVRGDPARALAAAEVRLEATYTAPMQHHNPIEPHVALASWEDGRLTLYASLQGVQACRDVLARSFGLPPPFRPRGRTLPRRRLRVQGAELVAVRDDRGDGGAARRPARAARAVAGRDVPHGGLPGGVDPPRRHRGSRRRPLDRTRAPRRRAELGRRRVLRSARPHLPDALRLSRGGDVPPPRPHPRAASDAERPPGHGPGSFALESAMDELAAALAIDPLELRLRNHADRDPHSGLPWSSKSLANATRSGRSGSDGGAGVPSLGRCETGNGSSDGAWRAPRTPCIGSAPPPARCPGGRHGGRPVGHARPRHRHLYGHEPGRRGDARAARGPRALRDGRQRLARVSARGRLDDGGERGPAVAAAAGHCATRHRRGVRGRSVAARRLDPAASRSGTAGSYAARSGGRRQLGDVAARRPEGPIDAQGKADADSAPCTRSARSRRGGVDEDLGEVRCALRRGVRRRQNPQRQDRPQPADRRDRVGIGMALLEARGSTRAACGS